MCVGQEPEMCRSRELTDLEYLTEYIGKIGCSECKCRVLFCYK